MQQQGIQCDNIILAGPSSPPTRFQVFATSPTSIQSYWSPPPEDDQNGVITSYVLTCQPEAESVPATFQMSYPTAGSYNVSGFSPTITYNCSVYAVTAAGRGPSTSHTVTMPDDGKLYVSLINSENNNLFNLYLQYQDQLQD